MEITTPATRLTWTRSKRNGNGKGRNEGRQAPKLAPTWKQAQPSGATLGSNTHAHTNQPRRRGARHARTSHETKQTEMRTIVAVSHSDFVHNRQLMIVPL